MDVVGEICDIERALTFIAASVGTEEIKAELLGLAGRVNRLHVDASLTIEALNPVFETNGHRGGCELTLMDLCYNAFMIGRNMENREDGGRCDWFTDTQPLMVAGVERIRKAVVDRMDYARNESRRRVTRNTEKTGCTLAPEAIDAGAACLYGHLEMWQGAGKPSYPQAPEFTKGKYQRAFASAVAESERVREAA